jgi:hypothetical protein
MFILKSFSGLIILFLLASSIFVWIFYAKNKKEYYFDVTTLLIDQLSQNKPLTINTKNYDLYHADLHGIPFDVTTNKKKIYLIGN